MTLRVRLLAALLGISALTLAAVALLLLPPLQDRLAEQSRDALRQAVLGTRASLEASLMSRRQPAGLDDARDTADKLAGRTGARVIIHRVPIDVTEPPAFDSSITDDPTRTDDVFRAERNGSTVYTNLGGTERIAMPVPATGPGRSPSWIVAVRQSQPQASQAFGVVQRAFVAASVISFGLAVVIGVFLSGTLVRRLRRLRSSALALASRGVGAPPPPRDDTRDEVGDLGRALHSMQEALRRQEAARRAFVATASHELRTPITSLQGNLELLAEDLEHDALDRDDAISQVAGAQQQLRRLANLATELLDLSRLDAGVELRHEPIDIAEIARAVAAEFAQQATAQRVLIEVAEPRGAVWAGGDPGAVARIVRILIDNALRFCSAGGLITVTAHYAGEHAVLDVRDDGPGVLPEERELIFKRFQRGSRTGGEGGFGLGLAIGRELARRMSGELELQPEPDRDGALFTCRLPISMPGDVDSAPDDLSAGP